jgi:colanic acid/amylovoran biosynthesis glycosyltransferase
MRVAYLTSMYPAVSHTFIRRELNELERQLGVIDRFAIRETPYSVVDQHDVEEDRKTFRAFSQPLGRWALAALRTGLAHPRASLRGLRKTLDLARQGHRGLACHLAYFAEAVLFADEMSLRGVEHVHVHFGTNPTAVAQIIRALGGPTYSFTVHGPDEFDAPIGFSLASKLEDSSFVVAISHYCSAQLQRWALREHWHKIQIVRCGVSDEYFEQALPIDPASRSLVCVGRLTPQKGQLLLVEAFADALELGVDAELVLAGDGELRQELEASIARRGVQSRVKITGWLDGESVQKELLGARALVLPSYSEGLPVVIMEAFALGRPVLSTYVAGIPELVHAPDNGWLVPAGSREALTAAIIDVMNKPVAELERMAASGREMVRRLHHTPTETAKLAARMLQAHEQRQTQPNAAHLPHHPAPGTRSLGNAAATGAVGRGGSHPAVTST